MKILFHLGHPAHFHLFKNVIENLQQAGHHTIILIKKKDVLEQLLIEHNIEYRNLLPEGRKDSKMHIALGLLKQDWKMLRICKKYKPDLLIGTSVSISHVGKLLLIPSINVNEDDAEVVPMYAKLAYPHASVILAPTVCSTGKWEYKTIHYNGYHELAYLHPDHFTPDFNIVKKYIDPNEPFFILRFAKLNAHHDKGITGISHKTTLEIINILSPKGQLFITSERPLEPEFEEYRLQIKPSDMHHMMAYAQLYIGDSQTMAAEAGVLGTPFIRSNDFVGRIGYLEELESKYELGFGVKPSNEIQLITILKELVENKNLKNDFSKKRKNMLNEKINVATFLTNFIIHYKNNQSQPIS